MAYKDYYGKFKKMGNSFQAPSKEQIEKEKINMGAMYYVHVHNLLVALSQSRIFNEPNEYYYILDTLLDQVDIVIREIINIDDLRKKMNSLQSVLSSYEYSTYCINSGCDTKDAFLAKQFDANILWKECKNIFRVVYNAMYDKGLILPENASDNIGKYLQEFGIETNNILQNKNASN